MPPSVATNHSDRLSSKFAIRLAVLIVFMCSANAAFAISHTYTNTDSINFNSTSASCASPIIRNIVVADSFNIEDVKLGFNATHTYRGDIRVIVRHPDGTLVTVINSNGGDSNDNYDLEVSDTSGNALNDGGFDNTGSPFYDRIASPSNPLSAFDGKNSTGTWQIIICDAFGGDSGTYNRAQLILEEEETARSWFTYMWNRVQYTKIIGRLALLFTTNLISMEAESICP